MRIISLNTWGGRAGKQRLLSFFREHADTVDIFCLQEIWSAPHQNLEGKLAGGTPLVNEEIMVHGLHEISVALPGHRTFFRPHFGDNYGLLMLIRKECTVINEGDVFVYKERGHMPSGDLGNHARNIQYATTIADGGPVTVINFHGLWNGNGKTDTKDRLRQSRNILEFAKHIENPLILCGDFNLLPDTESIRILERAGLRNLISEFGVTSTRTSFYSKPQKFADYVFISKDIQLKDFKVLPGEVSDHSPLLVEM